MLNTMLFVMNAAWMVATKMQKIGKLMIINFIDGILCHILKKVSETCGELLRNMAGFIGKDGIYAHGVLKGKKGKMRDKPKVGQILYSLNIGNAARHTESKLTQVEVTKVGRKYFTCKRDKTAYWGTHYHIDTWHERSNTIGNSRLYETPQEWEDEKEATKICKRISDAFEYGYNRQNVVLSDLREIERIIEGKK